MEKSPEYIGPKRFAHRGLVQYAPENTIGAFEAAIEYGCEGIELDIRCSSDGVPIIVHDGNFRRMTRGKLETEISEMTKDEITGVTLPFAGHLLPHDPPVPYSEGEGSARTYTDEQVKEFEKTDSRTTHLTAFEDFDKWFEGVDSDITIELEFCDDAIVNPMFDILDKSKNCSRYIAFSGNKERNYAIQERIKAKGLPEGLRIGANVRHINDEVMDYLRSFDIYEIGLDDFKFEKKDVDMLKDMGVLVFSNLGDYPEWWEKIMEYGIAGFKTNYAEAFTEWYVNRKQ